MKKKALITGITGSHLADFLLVNTHWDIFGMCRWRSPQRPPLPDVPGICRQRVASATI